MRISPRIYFAPALAILLASLAAAPLAGAQNSSKGGPIAEALQELGADVNRYNDHIVTLASPFMEGRLPGTNGMEVAKDYVEFWFRQAGLRPAFHADGQSSFRQPFPLGHSMEFGDQAFARVGTSSNDGAAELFPFKVGVDFQMMSLGSSGEVTAPVVSVGYSIEEGPNGYTSFLPGQDLSGKVALVFRFEPMGENGQSLWSNGTGWTSHSGYGAKVDAVAAHNPAAILIVNTPGADDPRVQEMPEVGSGGTKRADAPVMLLSTEAATRLLDQANSRASLMDLRMHADEGGAPVELGFEVKVATEINREPLIAENVGGLLLGKGQLGHELIVVGAHLDHLGMGDFGSRSGPGELHPGADDNASGSSGVLMLADKLAASYAQMEDGAQARSILFLCFSGEESGLNGSNFYVNNSPMPLESHAMMINFDMIGRIVDQRLSISGTNSAEQLLDLVAPLAQASELTVTLPKAISGASDHTPFYRKGMPVLFGAISDFHGDYHTPRDTSTKINRVDAVRTVHLFQQIVFAVAQHQGAWTFIAPTESNAGSRSASLGSIKIRFGVAPGNYDDEDPGINVASVTPGASAEKAGILAGDRMVRWNGQKILGVREWMGMLGDHKPGDVVKVGVIREGKEITIDVKLQAKPANGRQ
jgi:peptidase M28-like protein/PDZ domain-containing protein